MFKASSQDNNGLIELVGKYVEVNSKRGGSSAATSFGVNLHCIHYLL